MYGQICQSDNSNPIILFFRTVACPRGGRSPAPPGARLPRHAPPPARLRPSTPPRFPRPTTGHRASPGSPPPPSSASVARASAACDVGLPARGATSRPAPSGSSIPASREALSGSSFPASREAPGGSSFPANREVPSGSLSCKPRSSDRILLSRKPRSSDRGNFILIRDTLIEPVILHRTRVRSTIYQSLDKAQGQVEKERSIFRANEMSASENQAAEARMDTSSRKIGPTTKSVSVWAI